MENFHETVMVRWKYNNIVHILTEKFSSSDFNEKVFEMTSSQLKANKTGFFDIGQKEYPYALYLDIEYDIWKILKSLFNMDKLTKDFENRIDMIINELFDHEERKNFPISCLKSILCNQKEFIFDVLKNKKIYFTNDFFSYNNWSRFTSIHFILFKKFDTMKQFYKRILYAYNKCINFENSIRINVLYVYLPFGQELTKTQDYIFVNPYITKPYERFFAMNFNLESLYFKFCFFVDEKEYFRYLIRCENIMYSGKIRFLPDNDEKFRNNLIFALKKTGWEIRLP